MRRRNAAVGIDRLISNIEHGRFERALSALTAVGAVITGAEIWLEHDRASFGNRMMWLPVAWTPVVSGRGGRLLLQAHGQDGPPGRIRAGRRQQSAGTVSPPPGQRPAPRRPEPHQVQQLDKVQPGDGAPTFAPLLFAMVGGMGLLAAVLRREDD